jgi:hypothetical protein
MPGSGKQPAQPIYPRPVSPLHYEPLVTRPEDVLWEQDDTEERSDNEEGLRAAKKRRIEKAGEAYLRGEPLFILSAGIRGPLGDGWVNPWSKQKRRRRDLGGESLRIPRKAEVPETVERGGRDGRNRTQKRHDRETVILKEKNPMRPAKQVENHRRSPVHHDPFLANTTSLEDRKTAEASHGVAWLKKDHIALTGNHDFYTENIQQHHGSPSRIKQPVPAEINNPLQAEHGRHLNNETSDPGSFDGRAETLIKILRKRGNAVKSAISTRPQEVAEAQQPPSTSQGEDDSLSTKQPQSPPGSIPQDTVQIPVAKQTHFPTAGALEQTLPSPPSEGSSIEQETPQGEYPLVIQVSSFNAFQASDQPESLLGAAMLCPINRQPEDSKQQSEILDPIEVPDAHSLVPPPTLSTETSRTTIVGIMPSAQVALAVQAPPLNESLPCTGDKLSEKDQEHSQEEEERAFYLSTQAAIAATHLQLQNELTTPQALTASTSTGLKLKPTTKLKSKSGITPFSVFNNPNPMFITAHNPPNTQEMLNAVTPFDLTTTVKKSPRTTIPPNSASPTIATHQAVRKRASKVKKKASFALPDTDSTFSSNSGSSQASIKTSLKVSKCWAGTAAVGVGGKSEEGVAMVAGEATGTSIPDFGKPGLDMETSIEGEGESLAGDQDMTGTALSKPITTTSSSSSKSTSAKQDAQMLPPTSFRYHLAYDNSGKNLPDHSVTDDGLGFAAGDALERGYRGKDGDVHVDAGDRKDGTEHDTENAPFDLSAAMDEVGSFLLSWDTEREGREMQRLMKSNTQGGDGAVAGKNKNKNAIASQGRERERERNGESNEMNNPDGLRASLRARRKRSRWSSSPSY